MAGERRSSSIRIRLSPREREEVTSRSVRAGMTVSAYVRRRCLGPDTGIVGAVDVEELRKTRLELKRAGVNLNQIARQLNAFGECGSTSSIVEASVRQVADAATAISDTISKGAK